MTQRSRGKARRGGPDILAGFPFLKLTSSQRSTITCGCEPGGIRTHDQGIKSPVLCR